MGIYVDFLGEGGGGEEGHQPLYNGLAELPTLPPFQEEYTQATTSKAKTFASSEDPFCWLRTFCT